MMLSADAKYITQNLYQSNYFTYRADNGERVSELSGYQYHLYGYMNSTDIIGFQTNYETPNQQDLIKFNVRNSNIEVMAQIENSYNIFFNSKGKACVYERDNQLFYFDIKGSAGPQKLCEGFDRIDALNINDDNVSVVYTEESKTYVALYRKNTLQFRKRHERSDNYWGGTSNAIN